MICDMQGVWRFYIIAVFIGTVIGQSGTTTSEIEGKFTASKRRLNTLDPKTTEAQKFVILFLLIFIISS